MKEMEWGVNSKTNTTYMNYEFDIDSLYSTIVKNGLFGERLIHT